MPRMVWQDDLNTGIKVIDNQHRRIVEMINHLHDAMAHRDRQEIGDILDELVDYTLSHFTFEESLMEDAGYEFTRAHKRVHEVFVKRVSDYRLRFRAGEDMATSCCTRCRTGCSTISATTTRPSSTRCGAICTGWAPRSMAAAGWRARCGGSLAPPTEQLAGGTAHASKAAATLLTHIRAV